MAIHITEGSGPPVGSPAEVGQHYVDTTNNLHYLSVGNTDPSDWLLVPASADNSLLGLDDTPGSYAGQAGKSLRVNSNADATVFEDTILLDNVDTPQSYGGAGGYALKVKQTEDGIEFVPGSGGSLPNGGVTDDILVKDSAVDGDATWQSLDTQPTITDLDSRVGINETDIGNNTTAIGDNTTDIGTNTTNIGTNTTDIGDNSSDITDLQTNKEDVVNKGAASGYAPLGGDSRVPKINMPTDTQYKDEKGGPNGYAPLDSGSRVPKVNLPADITYDGIDTINQNRAAYVDAINGSDTLDANRGNIDKPFQTINGALAYVTTQSPGPDNDWSVRIQPGVYIEPPLNVPGYTGIFGIDQLKVKIAPLNDTAPLLTMGIFTNLFNLNITGDIGLLGTGNITQSTISYPFAAASTIISCLISNGTTAIDIANGAGTDGDIGLFTLSMGQLGDNVTNIYKRGPATLLMTGVYCAGTGVPGNIGCHFVDGSVVWTSGNITNVETGIKLDNCSLNMSGADLSLVKFGVVADNNAQLAMTGCRLSASTVIVASEIAGSIGIQSNTTVTDGTIVKLTGCTLSNYESGAISSGTSFLEFGSCDILGGSYGVIVNNDGKLQWVGGTFQARDIPNAIGTIAIQATNDGFISVTNILIPVVEKFIVIDLNSKAVVTNCNLSTEDTLDSICIDASDNSTLYVADCIFGSLGQVTASTAIRCSDASVSKVVASEFTNYSNNIIVANNAKFTASACKFEVKGILTGTVGILSQDDSLVIGQNLSFVVQTGMYLQDTSSILMYNALFLGTSIEFQQVGAASISLTQCDINTDKILVADWSKVRGNYNSTKPGDNALVVLNPLYVGVPESGYISSMGEGGAYTRGMLVYEYNINTETFTDVTADAQEEGGADVGIPTVDPGSAIYFGTRLISGDGSGSVDFSGLKLFMSQIPVVGDGILLYEAWNGSSWFSINSMLTQGYSPYRYSNLEIAEVGNEYNSRLADNLNKSWERNNPIVPPLAEDYYWIRMVIGSNWLNSSWEQRIKITIPAAEVSSGMQIDMPIYLDLGIISDPTFWVNLNTDGSDLRITDSSGVNLLAQHLVFFDKTNSLGEMYFNSGSLTNASDNVFYIYYKNAGADPVVPLAANGQYNCWKFYDAVYHFQDGPENWNDATINQYNLTNDVAGGMIQRQDIFTQSVQTNADGNSGITMPDIDLFKDVGSKFCVESYVTRNAVELGKIYSLGNNQSQANRHDYFGMEAHSSGGIIYNVNATQYNGLSSANLDDGTWHQVVLYLDGTDLWTWRDGSSDGTTTPVLPATASTAPPKIGNRGQWGGAWWWSSTGGLDEIRITKNTISPGWFPTIYNNMRNPNTFTIFSPAETEATAEGSNPIDTTPRFSQTMLYPDCTVINPDGFIEFFGNARPIEESKATTASFKDSVGTKSAGIGEQVWLSSDFGVIAPIRFPPNVSTRVTDVTVAANDVDSSCDGKFRMHFISRNDDVGGNILIRILAYRSPNDYVYAETEGAAPTTPSAVVESFAIATIDPGTVDTDGFVTGTFSFPVRDPQISFNERANLFWATVERVGTSELDTYQGDIDVLSIRSYNTKWRMGEHIDFFE